MGSDATCYVFDYRAYAERVVPAIDAFVDLGARPQWLDAILNHFRGQYWEWRPSRTEQLGYSFHDVCTYLDHAFAFGQTPAVTWREGWDRRACRSDTCPARDVCPLHVSRDQLAAEQFNRLFEACVIRQCVGEGQFMGRSVGALVYAPLLGDALVLEYLRKLELRGFVVGYKFGNSDGIHRWLDVEETRELVRLLEPLDLPPVAPSFAAIRASYRAGAGYDPPPPYTFPQLRLSFLRTVARLAAAEDKGILWGNDLSMRLRNDLDE
jgi:hypothetical protein